MTSERRPFRFGMQARGGTTAAEWLATARQAEELGFSTIQIFDHFVHGLGPVAALAAAAMATRTVRLGSFVFANDYRHPVLLAQEAATVDQLSDGRLELGLGAGWDRAEYTAAGLPFDPPGQRIARLEEAIQIVKRLWTEEGVTTAGEHYAVTDLTLAVRPVQRPHPPILIGGGGQRLLELGGRHADIVGLAPRAFPDGSLDPTSITAQATARKLGWIRAAAASRPICPEINVYVYAVEITDDAPAAAERLTEGFELPANEILTSPHTLIGTIEEIVETLHQRRERDGITYITVGSHLADVLAPVVTRLAGT